MSDYKEHLGCSEDNSETLPLLQNERKAIPAGDDRQRRTLHQAHPGSKFLVDKYKSNDHDQLVTGREPDQELIKDTTYPINSKPEEETRRCRSTRPNNKPLWAYSCKKKSVCCCMLGTFPICILIQAIILGAIVGFVLSQYPHPTIQFEALTFDNDTVPLNVYGFSVTLPPSIDTFWYDKLDVGLPKPKYPVTLKFVKGEQTCDPLKRNTKKEIFSSKNIPINPNSFPIDFITNKYITSNSNLTANISVTTDLTSVSNPTDINKETVTICILDDWNSYQEFQQPCAQCDLTKCLYVASYIFSASNKTVHTFNYTFDKSDYYFIVVLATQKLQVEYSYDLKYQFYNLTDYNTSSSDTCQISSMNNWKNCTLLLDGEPGCFFVQATLLSTSPSNTKTKVVGSLHRKKYIKSLSTIVLSAGFAVLFVEVVVVIITSSIVHGWKKKKWCFSHMNTSS